MDKKAQGWFFKNIW